MPGLIKRVYTSTNSLYAGTFIARTSASLPESLSKFSKLKFGNQRTNRSELLEWNSIQVHGYSILRSERVLDSFSIVSDAPVFFRCDVPHAFELLITIWDQHTNDPSKELPCAFEFSKKFADNLTSIDSLFLHVSLLHKAEPSNGAALVRLLHASENVFSNQSRYNV